MATTIDASAPPDYLDTDLSDLPAYTGRQTRRKEFTYDIGRKGHDTLQLTLSAQRRFSANIAAFVGETPITGAALLQIQKPSSVQEINLVVRGYLTRLGRVGQVVFLSVEERLWDASMGAPKEISEVINVGARPRSDQPKQTTKPSFQIEKGTYRWNFVIHLPQEATMSDEPGGNPGTQKFRLPETFIERLSRGSINYDISLQVKYSGLFGATTRELAYSEGSALLGPDVDPEGWQALPSVAVTGKLFTVRQVALLCTVYLAKPLSYTRGSAIPVVLRLTSTDQEALDVLSAPEAVNLVLRRKTTYDHQPLATSQHSGVEWGQDDLETSSVASCWRDEADGPLKDAHTRFVRAELALFTKLKPSSRLGGFGILYDIVLSAFAAPGFESDNEAILLEHPVEIVTAYLPGPRPILYRPPPAFDPAKGAHTGFMPLIRQPWWTTS